MVGLTDRKASFRSIWEAPYMSTNRIGCPLCLCQSQQRNGNWSLLSLSNSSHCLAWINLATSGGGNPREPTERSYSEDRPPWDTFSAPCQKPKKFHPECCHCLGLPLVSQKLCSSSSMSMLGQSQEQRLALLGYVDVAVRHDPSTRSTY